MNCSPQLKRPLRELDAYCAEKGCPNPLKPTVHGYNDDVETDYGTFGVNDMEDIRPAINRCLECFRYMRAEMEAEKEIRPARIGAVAFDDAIESTGTAITDLEDVLKTFTDALRGYEERG